MFLKKNWALPIAVLLQVLFFAENKTVVAYIPFVRTPMSTLFTGDATPFLNHDKYNHCYCGHFHSSSKLRSQSSQLFSRTSSSSWLYMGMQIKIRIVGKVKNGSSDKWLQDAYKMYDGRLKSNGLDVATVWHKNDNDLISGISTDIQKGHSIILLDPNGKSMTSERFSTNLYDWLENGGSRISFVIGGADGLPSTIRFSKDPPLQTKISLSSLTFTHQFARTILMEQIYRAAEIRKGSGYHK